MFRNPEIEKFTLGVLNLVIVKKGLLLFSVSSKLPFVARMMAEVRWQEAGRDGVLGLVREEGGGGGERIDREGM